MMIPPSEITSPPLHLRNQLEEPPTVQWNGRLIAVIQTIPLTLWHLITKIIQAIWSFFFGQPTIENAPKRDAIKKSMVSEEEEQRWGDLLAKVFLEEEKAEKLGQLLAWALNLDQDSQENCQDQIEELTASFVKKSEAREMSEPGAYLRWVESLEEDPLRSYIRSLGISGSHPPLYYHFKQEHQSAMLTGKSEMLKIERRLRIILPVLSDEQAESLRDCHDFWNLIYKFPEAAASSLSPESLAILAQNKSRHQIEFKMLVTRLPENDSLVDKLTAISPSCTDQILFELNLKAKRLRLFQFSRHGSPVPQEERIKISKELKQAFDKASEINREEAKLQGTAQPPGPKPKSKWTVGQPGEKTPLPKIQIAPSPPQLDWSTDQYSSYLKEMDYKNKIKPTTEEAVFYWLLDHVRPDTDDLAPDAANFISHLLSKPLYIEETTARLQQMSTVQFRRFVKLLDEKAVDILWKIEAKQLFAQSHEKAKKKRLKTALPELSKNQFEASLKCQKFYSLMKSYPRSMGHALSIDQWKSIAENLLWECEAANALTAMIEKMDFDQDSQLAEKMEMASLAIQRETNRNELSNEKKLLRQEIQRKLPLCRRNTQDTINANILEPKLSQASA